MMKMIEILKTENAVVRLCEDTIMGTYSIGLRTKHDMEYKFINKELFNLLKEELSNQEGRKK